MQEKSNLNHCYLLFIATLLLTVIYAPCGNCEDKELPFTYVKNPNCAHAWELFKQGKSYEALNEYKSVVKIDPKSANAHYGIACCYSQLDKDQEALKEYAIAYNLNPKHTGVLNDRSNLYSSLGRYEEAIADSTKAIQLEDWNASNYSDRSLDYFQLEKYDKALSDATQAITRDGKFADPHFYRGIIFYQRDQYKKALIAFRFALDCEPTYHLAHYYLGRIHYENRNYRKAIDHLTQALTLDPIDKSYYMYRAWANKKLGKLEAANADFEKAKKYAPDDRRVKRWQLVSDYEKKYKNLSPAQLFAIGCSAISDKANGDNHEMLSPRIPTQNSINDKRKLLNEWWGITSSAELYSKLTWIDNGGHRQLFNEIQNALASEEEESLAAVKKKWSRRWSSEELNYKIEVVKKYGNNIGEKGLTAWDYCRYIDLCRWGYLAGYLKEDEAWKKIMPAAIKLQNTFSSWDDLATNYLIGRRFWNKEISQESSQRYKKIVKWLTSDEDSPWLKTDWQTKLNS